MRKLVQGKILKTTNLDAKREMFNRVKYALKKFLLSFLINAQTNPMHPEIDLPLPVHGTLSYDGGSRFINLLPLCSDSWP